MITTNSHLLEKNFGTKLTDGIEKNYDRRMNNFPKAMVKRESYREHWKVKRWKKEWLSIYMIPISDSTATINRQQISKPDCQRVKNKHNSLWSIIFICGRQGYLSFEPQVVSLTSGTTSSGETSAGNS